MKRVLFRSLHLRDILTPGRIRNIAGKYPSWCATDVWYPFPGDLKSPWRSGVSAHSSDHSQSWSLDIQGLVKDRYYDDEWAAVGTVCVAVRISFCFPSISGECSASSHPRDLRKPAPLLSSECGIISSDLKVMVTLCWTHWFGAASFQKRSMHSGQPVFMHLQGILNMSNFLPDTPFSSGRKLQTLSEPLIWNSPTGSAGLLLDQISTSFMIL